MSDHAVQAEIIRELLIDRDRLRATIAALLAVPDDPMPFPLSQGQVAYLRARMAAVVEER